MRIRRQVSSSIVALLAAPRMLARPGHSFPRKPIKKYDVVNCGVKDGVDSGVGVGGENRVEPRTRITCCVEQTEEMENGQKEIRLVWRRTVPDNFCRFNRYLCFISIVTATKEDFWNYLLCSTGYALTLAISV